MNGFPDSHPFLGNFRKLNCYNNENGLVCEYLYKKGFLRISTSYPEVKMFITSLRGF